MAVAENSPRQDARLEEAKESGLIGRAAGAAARFAEGYFELAQREAKRDMLRFGIGVGMLAMSFVLTLTFVILLQALIIAWLAYYGIPPHVALTIIAVADLFLIVVLFFLGRSLVRAPILPQSRKILRDTVAMITGEGAE